MLAYIYDEIQYKVLLVLNYISTDLCIALGFYIIELLIYTLTY